MTHSFTKLPGSDTDVRVQSEFGGWERSHPVDAREEAVARRAIDVAAEAARDAEGQPGWPWFARVDMLVDPDSETEEPAVLELEVIEPSLFFHLPGLDDAEHMESKG